MPATKLPLRKKSLRYVTANGKKLAVILDLDDLELIERKIEDLQETLAFERAKREATGFVTLEDFGKELKAAGKL